MFIVILREREREIFFYYLAALLQDQSRENFEVHVYTQCSVLGLNVISI